ncbi:2-hydroxychromene-2-carboxylate isomerase [Thauera sp. Sel9]|uniref:2-hydroxychromene-2-carboxylate isomerase n=1 Tax=Thauera sp. Sel9 TaxID=2974299 RepID=UPI0021E14C43|nr:2-hydroxychromene-2-carboxylate isomerase [Thauera sp. Sel9]MCV2218670.1 2-hydroxychromene-2-carboxylate isomerase [Thauera sp. Sel9]
MAEPIDFYFDFSSPYGYFMAEQIDALAAAHGRSVRWRPFLLGAVYKVTGDVPLPSKPLKGDYSKHDFERSARFLGLSCRIPDVFPIGTQIAARAFYWLEDRDAAAARRFALAALRAYFVDGRDISQQDAVLDIAAAHGADRAALVEALAGDAIRNRLKDECAQAIARGVFGSPFVIVDGEPFWGVDRVPQIVRWLETGGF